jgi:hypothetical protein
MPSKVILNYKTIELNSFSSKQLLKHLKSKFQEYKYKFDILLKS